MEPKGMTPDIVEKLNEKAKVLTGDRRKRSKMVPEELMSADSIRGNVCMNLEKITSNNFYYNFIATFFLIFQ